MMKGKCAAIKKVWRCHSFLILYDQEKAVKSGAAKQKVASYS